MRETIQQIAVAARSIARTAKWTYTDYRINHAPADKVILRSGTLFIHIPKCAGTSIANALYGKKLPHITLQEYALKLSEQKLRELNTVSVVRDPLDRIRSAYKYVVRGYPGAKVNRKHPYHRFHQAANLEDFLEKLEQSYVDCIRLLWPQSRFLQLGNSVPDWLKVYRFSELERLQADLDISLKILNRTPATATEQQPLSNRAVKNIRTLYAADFETFNFHPSLR